MSYYEGVQRFIEDISLFRESRNVGTVQSKVVRKITLSHTTYLKGHKSHHVVIWVNTLSTKIIMEIGFNGLIRAIAKDITNGI